MMFFKGLSGQNIALERERSSPQKTLESFAHCKMGYGPGHIRVFSGAMENDETYLADNGKTKKEPRRPQVLNEEEEHRKHLSSVYFVKTEIWAEVVPDVETKSLIPLIKQRVRSGSIVYSDKWKSYTGVAAKGYAHRLVKNSKGEYSTSKGNRINGLEGFWGYLKKKLTAK